VFDQAYLPEPALSLSRMALTFERRYSSCSFITACMARFLGLYLCLIGRSPLRRILYLTRCIGLFVTSENRCLLSIIQ
jgi:hypothetical protein